MYEDLGRRRMNMVTAAGMPGEGGGLAGLGQEYAALDPASRSWVDDLVRAGVPLATALVNLATDTPMSPWGGGINPATGMPYGYAPTASGFGGMSITMLLLLGVGAYLLLGPGLGGSRKRR